MFPNPEQASTEQIAFALGAAEALLRKHADVPVGDVPSFFLTAIFATAEMCRADLERRVGDAAVEDELNGIVDDGRDDDSDG